MSETSQPKTQSGNVGERVGGALEMIADLQLQLAGLQDDLTGIREELTDLQAELMGALLELQAGRPSRESDLSPDQDSQAGVAEGFLECVDIEKWLQDREITIKNRRNQNPFDKSFDRLAIYLGQHFDVLRGLYGALKKRAGGSPHPRNLSVKDLPPKQINKMVQFGTDLHRNGFLKKFKYVKKDRLLVFDPQEDGRVTNFFTGGWLERYVVLTASEYLSKRNPHNTIETMMNPKVLLPNGQDFELDIVIANAATVLWFECKTGKDYPAYVAKYGEVAKTFMQIDSKHAALVLLEELTDEEKANNSQFAGMSVLNLSDIDRFLENLAAANGDYAADAHHTDSRDRTEIGAVAGTAPVGIASSGTAPADTPSISASPLDAADESELIAAPDSGELHAPALNSLLRRANLRPLQVDERRRIIGDLVSLHQASEQRSPLRELVARLAAAYQTEQSSISKSRIDDMMKALLRSGCCLLDDYPGYEKQVWFLRDDLTTEDAFAALARLYIWTLIRSLGPQAWNDQIAREAELVVWGDCGQMSEETADGRPRVNEAIEQLLSSGQCVRQEVDNRSTLLTQGERFIQ